MYGGFQGALNWSPLMPRDASLSDGYKPDIYIHVYTYMYMCLDNPIQMYRCEENLLQILQTVFI